MQSSLCQSCVSCPAFQAETTCHVGVLPVFQTLPKCLGQCPHWHFWAVLCMASWALLVLVGLFQLRIFCSSVWEYSQRLLWIPRFLCKLSVTSLFPCLGMGVRMKKLMKNQVSISIKCNQKGSHQEIGKVHVNVVIIVQDLRGIFLPCGAACPEASKGECVSPNPPAPSCS